jgi:hypothetical protein
MDWEPEPASVNAMRTPSRVIVGMKRLPPRIERESLMTSSASTEDQDEQQDDQDEDE